MVIPYRVVQRVAPQIGVALGHRTHEYNPYWDSPEVCVESRRTWADPVNAKEEELLSCLGTELGVSGDLLSHIRAAVSGFRGS